MPNRRASVRTVRVRIPTLPIAALAAMAATAAVHPVAHASAAASVQQRRMQRVVVPPGGTKTVDGSLNGREIVDYLVPASSGQTLRIELTTGSSSTSFDVTAPGADSAMFVGARSGSWFSAKLAKPGDYRVRVSLLPAAARRGAPTRYSISFTLAGASASAAGSRRIGSARR